jgi:hypothetical protein
LPSPGKGVGLRLLLDLLEELGLELSLKPLPEPGEVHQALQPHLVPLEDGCLQGAEEEVGGRGRGKR